MNVSLELDEGNDGDGWDGVVAGVRLGVRLGVLEPEWREQVEAGVLGVGVLPLTLDCR